MAALKSLDGPAHRAEKMPGAPSSASTQRPESSESAGSFEARVAARAFSLALPMKLSSVSSGSGRPRAPAEITSIAKGFNSSSISAALPLLWLARTSFFSMKRRGIASGNSQRLLLQRVQFRDALAGKLQELEELCFGECVLFRGALHLDD